MLKPTDREKLAKALFRLTLPTVAGNRIIRAVQYDKTVYVTDSYACVRLTCDDSYDTEKIVDRVVELQEGYAMVHKRVVLTDKVPTRESFETIFNRKPSDRHDATLNIKLLEKVLSVAKCISSLVNLECHGTDVPTALYTVGDGLRVDATQMPVRER